MDNIPSAVPLVNRDKEALLLRAKGLFQAVDIPKRDLEKAAERNVQWLR